MIVVTGGAGFIGSNIVKELNDRGINDIIIVDHLEKEDEKQKNIQKKKYGKYFDKKEFLHFVLEDKLDPAITHIIHMGACSSTTLTDEKYYQENNFEYSCHFALDSKSIGLNFHLFVGSVNLA